MINLRQIVAFIVNKHHFIARYVLVAACVMAIFLLYPRQQFNYDFDIGKPWNYKDLYAPLTFTVQKMPDSLKMEQQRIIDNFMPYYTRDSLLGQQAIAAFKQDYRNQYSAIKKNLLAVVKLTAADSVLFVQLGTTMLDSIYRRGLIDLSCDTTSNEAYQQLVARFSRINLLSQNNVSTTVSTSRFLTTVPQACQEYSVRLRNMPDDLKRLVCNHIHANIVCDTLNSRKFLAARLSEIATTAGRVQQNEEIIRRGVIVQEEHYRKLITLKNNYGGIDNRKNQYTITKYGIDIGYLLLTIIVLLAYLTFIHTFLTGIYYNLRKLAFLLIGIVIFLYLFRYISDVQSQTNANFSLYVMPFCVFPIIIRNFFGTFIAYFTHLVIVLLACYVVPLGYDFAFVQIVVGLVAIVLNEKTYYWSQFFVDTAIIFVVYILAYLGTTLIQQNSLASVELSTTAWLVVNCFLTLLTYPLISIFERVFGFVSDIKLAELSHLNNRLLRELSHKAPGTFWHSLQVATLSESAATEIGANALLAKVGALYHDIGKTVRPGYFIENQKTEINPHDDLPYIESAHIIKSHVTDGIAIARKEGLPAIIIDFIRTHHGTSRTEFFYQKYLKENPNGQQNEKLFRYQGPLPYSKETAIVMISDSVEAASHSLKNPTDDDINRLVDHIIDSKIYHQQFSNCNLSFKDLNTIRKVLKKQLHSFYHVRISYPDVGTR
ncbi:MAG: HDIG domain-containing protein [Chitinophagales bacterium]|jgi:putative nucleotidyltransferase with HDIG domain|nr:HDIG domain-containing protein [Chitinophagales bacterium]